jgi:segregation and condensation protein B
MTENDHILKIQTLLLLSHKPVKLKELATVLAIDSKIVQEYVEKLRQQFNIENSGWWVVETNDAIQLVTNPSQADFIESYLEVERMADLTRPALEALTVISYNGPISKSTIDRIRGVNCALILRNLMIKGLVEEVNIGGERRYQITMDLLKHLGLSDISELPEYAKMHNHEFIKVFTNNSVEENKE